MANSRHCCAQRRIGRFSRDTLFNADVPVGSLNLYSHSAVAETDRDRDLVVVIAEYLGAGSTPSQQTIDSNMPPTPCAEESPHVPTSNAQSES